MIDFYDEDAAFVGCDDYFESEDYLAWDDGSNIGCSDCPDSECTGHCMSCPYRPI